MKDLNTNPKVFDRHQKVEMTVRVMSSLSMSKKLSLAIEFSNYIRNYLISKRYVGTKELRSVDIRHSVSKTCITVFIGFYHPINTNKISDNAELIRDTMVQALTIFRDVFTLDDRLSEQEKSCKAVNFKLLGKALLLKSKTLESACISTRC